MIKKIFTLLAAFLLVGYILYGIFAPKKQLDGQTCTDLQIVVDTLDRRFISEQQIVSMLTNAHLHPKEKALKDIRTRELELKLEENKLVKKVRVYKTPAGLVKIDVYQRLPILRIMTESENYYIDSDGKIMPAAPQVMAYVPIATGHIDRKFAREALCPLACFLHNNEFWEMQVEQIYVHPNKDIEITPRLGNHQILLGELSGFEEKLEHLRLFYEQALNKTGWNRYSKINLKYKNQIVCTKKL
ncbi:MAG: cell division protein FtsQ [Dysgonamonadaceae bacterium]|jgi:cell division protein FtsQ|nr:cell division protein FtsQ [Dysgonamonadaceae bacterium]